MTLTPTTPQHLETSRTRMRVGNASRSFLIKRSERALFVGRTNSGKTTLADRLIRFLGYRTVVLDPKHTWDFPGYQQVQVYDPDPNLIRQVFRPISDARTGWADAETFLNSVWHAGIPCVVYVDELTSLSTPWKTIPRLADFQRLGRQRGFGLWTATQRPKDIPNLFLTEADHWFVFDLRHEADREKCAGFLGVKVGDRITEEYAFWYSNPKERDAILFHQR